MSTDAASGVTSRAHALQSIASDREELVDAGRELFLSRAQDALAHHGQDLGFRAAGDEHHKAEPEAALVLVVDRRELPQSGDVGVAALLAARERRERCGVGSD